MAKCSVFRALPVAIFVMTSAAIFRIAAGNRCNRRCGDRPLFPQRSSHRIVGEIPWQAFIRYIPIRWTGPDKENFVCGGNIINERWILSATHCFYDEMSLGLEAEDFEVITSLLDRTRWQSDPGAQVRSVRRLILHERYDNDTGDHDVALLELDRPLSYNDRTQPICLSREGEHFTGMRCKVSGWGRKRHLPRIKLPHFTSASPNRLRTVDLPVISMEVCKRYTYMRIRINTVYLRSEICTLRTNPSRISPKDFCSGDSGGPLACLMSDGKFVLAGVVLINACSQTSPALYAKVSYYFAWINEKTGVDFD